MQCLTIAVKMCQGTFIKENIQKKLGAVCRADITVKTLNGEQSMKSIAGLRVSSSTAGDKEMVESTSSLHKKGYSSRY